ncbi:MAG: hypothetical protein H7Z41_00315 [Cytophagales bacterium]|nr:hypothetical protein [Armatimonadota bacterium]
MKNTLFLKFALVSGFAAIFAPVSAHPLQTTPASKAAESLKAASPKATPLAFREFFVPTPRELKLSDKVQQLNGKRVQITGFMAHMEAQPKGAFFLCARPVTCDEAGGGTGDLPPETIRVIVRGAKNQTIQSISRPVVVTGLLEIGNRPEADGTTSSLRLILDRPQNLPSSKTTTLAAKAGKPKKSPATRPALDLARRRP